jgi:outer membrane lipoprotein-sorting protein
MKYTLTILFLILSTIAASAAEDPVFSYPFDGNVNQLHQFKNVQSLKAKFKQTKHIPVLKNPVSSSGEFILNQKYGFYWHTIAPFENELIFINNKIIQRVEGKTLQPVEQKQTFHEIVSLFLALTTLEHDKITQSFFIFYQPTNDGWRLGLKPKHSKIQTLLKSIILEGSRYVDHIRVNGNGDYTEIDFFDFETPTKLDDKKFFIQ